MPDLNFQELSTVQNKMQEGPQTMVAAATVAPRSFLTRFTGTTPITTITPPVTGTCMLAFIFTTATANHLNTGGNIATAWTSIADRVMFLVYDPRTALWYQASVL